MSTPKYPSDFELVQSYVLYGIWAIISIPNICYISYQLKENWNEEWLMRRRRPLILIICILLFYGALIECPFYGITRIHHISPWINKIISTISYVLRFWLASFILLRIYLLYYDHEYNRSIVKRKWKILISPLPKQGSWFLENRQRKYGDEQWIIWHILVPLTAIYSVLFAVLRFIVPIHFDIFNDFHVYDGGCTLFWCLSVLIIGTYFWKKYPKLADVWLIRREITIFLLLLFAAIIIILIVVLVQILLDLAVTQLGIIVYSMIINCTLYVMVIYPQTAEIRKTKAIKKKITKEEELQISWEELVTTKDGYESFMDFLEKELSTENLLFLTEYVQLKTAMMEKQILREKIDKLKLKYTLNLPNSLPLSVIAKEFREEINVIDMVDKDKVDEISWKSMNKIYEKYVNENTADLEVNISSRRRKSILNVYKNESVSKTVETILPAMEKCVIEISSLLNDSRGRFCEQIVFTELAVQITKSKSDSKSGLKKNESPETPESNVDDIASRKSLL